MSKDVTVAEGKDLVPDFLDNFSGSTGFENVDNDCVSIPFLRLSQQNTPQVLPGKDHIANLQGGMYFNPTTGRIYDDPSFIILGFFRTWNVWHGEPPSSKFVRSITNDDFIQNYESKTTKNDKGKIVDQDGNRYQDTRNFLLLSASHPEDGILLYGMSSTGIPASKKWLAKASAIRVKDASGNLVQAPMWSRIWTLKTSFEQKPQGSYFQVSDIVDKGWIPAEASKVVKDAFDEAQSYDKMRIKTVEEKVDDTPEWAK